MLHIGTGFGFGKLDPSVTDAQMYHSETELAVQSEKWGFDSVWATEHHFFDYSLCPDNLLWLAHIAARTKNIKLGTGAVILPWNTQPIRVAEKLLMLDILSEGRALFGMGRGLSRKEFAPFGVPLEESRERFDESAEMIIRALKTGIFEGDGTFFATDPIALRPGPIGSWDGRYFTVAGSKDSMINGVANKAGLMSFILRPVDQLMETFNAYTDHYEEVWGEKAPPIMLNTAMYCHEDETTAVENHYKYVGRFFDENVTHYEMNGDHFATTKGYERYAMGSEMINKKGVSQAGRDYAEAALYGTPEMILDKFIWIQEQMGEFNLILQPAFGGMSHETAYASLDLFSREVMPKARQHYNATVKVSA
jgi:alkanesulfonate monooxygenase SsuD/methylene tetrahydromethanopterin reductase-like flavin-dependent oxidoreductase (luciferase family)